MGNVKTGEVIAGDFESAVTQALSQYNVEDAAIEAIRADFMTLKINGLEDAKGYRAVDEARRTVKKLRTGVEAKRRELKKDSIEFGRRIDLEAKRITERLEPVETYLQAEQDAVDNEVKRIADAKEAARLAKISDRVKTLFDLGIASNGVRFMGHGFELESNEVADMPDTDFTDYVALVREVADELAVKAAEAAKEVADLKAAQDKLAEDRRKLDEERAAIEAAKVQASHAEAVENVGLKLQTPAAEVIEFPQPSPVAEPVTTDAPALTDKKKMLAWADALDAIPKPEIKAANVMARAALALGNLTAKIRNQAEKL